MTLSLAISPCPNDTFAFAPLLQGKVDTEGLTFVPQFADILELNRLARTGAVDVCKLSYFTYALVQADYQLLEAGSALGQNCGPLLVSRAPISRSELKDKTVAIPGVDTTAHLLLEFFAPEVPHSQRRVMLFHEIMPAVERGEVDCGVIIHESRFTYPQHGLQLVQDLGEHWEQTTGQPIPLGGIVVRKTLGTEVAEKVTRVLQRSLDYAWAHPQDVMPFVRDYAQEMEEPVMKAHIDLYVNRYTRELGPNGHKAIGKLLEVADSLRALVS